MGRMSSLNNQLVEENNGICPHCKKTLVGIHLQYGLEVVTHRPANCDHNPEYSQKTICVILDLLKKVFPGLTIEFSISQLGGWLVSYELKSVSLGHVRDSIHVSRTIKSIGYEVESAVTKADFISDVRYSWMRPSTLIGRILEDAYRRMENNHIRQLGMILEANLIEARAKLLKNNYEQTEVLS